MTTRICTSLIHVSFDNYEINGYGLDLVVLLVSHLI